MDQVINYLYSLQLIYSWLILIYVLMSWLPNVRQSYIGELLGKIVEPYLKPFRKIIPPIGGVLDISPIVAWYALKFLVRGLEEVIRFLAGLLGVS
ncbi:YggT family protein [Cohnella sp. GCM10012308]|uniref:YggT family protein n=1 Tax=Cohnella sp. GCM10012308 TaxID=3317329 RepID=UPI00360BD697